MNEIRVLIADDHPLFRKGLRTLLASMPQTVVIGEATTGREAVELAQTLEPDVLLLDLQMPDGGGLGAIRELAIRRADARILVAVSYTHLDVYKRQTYGSVWHTADYGDTWQRLPFDLGGGLSLLVL